MDYNRLKSLAEGFVGRGCVDYPDELESVLRDTATTGIVRLQWDLLCPVLHYRLEKELNSAFSSSAELGDGSKELCQQLLRQLDKFEKPPFTIQRLCELLLHPKKHYKKLDYYMRAVEKNLLVVSTEEPDLEWMLSSRLEKPSQDEVKVNGTGHADNEEPHSPQIAPKPSLADKNSPPTAPTSTWSNLQEMTDVDKESSSDYDSCRRPDERESRDLLSPLGGLSGRKRSRDRFEEEEDKSSITVRQEADSTVNFEPPPFDSAPPLFQGVDESLNKRSREFVTGGNVSGEVDNDKGEQKERESCLSSSTEHVVGDGGGVGERESTKTVGEDGSNMLDRSGVDVAPKIQAVKQVSPECQEAMDTN